MACIDIEIINKRGLHARAAAKLTQLAERFDSNIAISKDDISINAKSIMQVLMLAAAKGNTITLSAEGDDADAALDAISSLINHRFDEDE